MNKIEYFITELDFIDDPKIKEIAQNLIGQLPDYFFEVAASSTGKAVPQDETSTVPSLRQSKRKYHPEYALGKEGLIRHTKAAVRIANDLLRLEMFKGLSEKKDLIITALLLHDGWKHGREPKAYLASSSTEAAAALSKYNNYAQSNHPLIAAEMVEELCEDKEIATQLATLIKTHMGQWNTDWKTGVEIMPKPETQRRASKSKFVISIFVALLRKIQSFVHLCDYLASRKFLEFNFEV